MVKLVNVTLIFILQIVRDHMKVQNKYGKEMNGLLASKLAATSHYYMNTKCTMCLLPYAGTILIPTKTA